MNVATITMPRTAARAKLRAVRTALHRKADAEYQQLERGYKELANGRPLINLTETIHAAPLDARGRPRLAIARADEHQVVVRSGPDFFEFDSRFWRRSGRTTRLRVVDRRADFRSPNGYALVPIVPPEVKRHHDLSRCHVLFEVDAWADRAIQANPDRDPYLLRHIGGDLWAVLGEWDLTELERAVMAGRRET